MKKRICHPSTLPQPRWSLVYRQWGPDRGGREESCLGGEAGGEGAVIMGDRGHVGAGHWDMGLPCTATVVEGWGLLSAAL